MRSHIQARQETIAQQLKCIQLDFMIAAELRSEKANAIGSSFRPVGDLSSLPRFIDHDGETIRDTSSDGLSYAGTVVRGGIGPSTASSSYQATLEQLPGTSTASRSYRANAEQLPFQ